MQNKELQMFVSAVFAGLLYYLGIVSNANSGTNNCSSLTGSTSAETFNTASGMASETIYDVTGTDIPIEPELIEPEEGVVNNDE